jgi:thiol:disulfide interchange protein
MTLPAIALLLFLGFSQYAPVTKYDPSRDAEKDIAAAVAEARRTGRNVLLEVGGEWCSWCHILDKYFVDNPKLTELRDRNYLTIKINFSPENLNEALLSMYPKIPGYPHIFVVDSSGKLLKSQDTSPLEEGKSYNLGRFTDFLNKWAPSNK